MKARLLKIKAWLLEKNHMLIIVIIAIMLAMGAVIYFQHKKVVKLTDLYQTEVKLKNALLDTMRIYQNKEKEWVAEKLTIQETVANLEKINGLLTESQKELLRRIKEVEKKNDVIVAALITTNVKIDSLLHMGETVIDTVNKTVNFNDSLKVDKKLVYYNLTVNKVLPAFPNIKPGLMFNSVSFPNKQFIEFHWLKNKKANYPVTFSVSNSNDYFKTINIDSYAIPEVKYDGTKFGQWISKNGRTVMYIGIGTAVGGTAVWLLTK